ncbi:TetR family transcriptional regulator [Actinorhabdospora filicis]|uniref:TetR family transcriptional regulator n=1 Tax=Actinorhabdospora filicis TaxID=1785913 RepID=A0A9W6SFI9_9ACTN|nr:TetR/AcrR family transcriptional regulator [Actinorhabdospora filicis]GLZ76225.1 TetR family transcriptional regulator [Actinorhabdospora filicis]
MPEAIRADARRNRDLLLAAAREAFAESGTEASLRDVARRAGVGIGTLYRHFPNREAVLEALTGEDFDRLATRGAELAAAEPYGALLTWLRELGAVQRSMKGLPESVLAATRDHASDLHASCEGMQKAGASLLARAQEAGVVRGDLSPLELLALVAGVAWAADYATGDAFFERLLTVAVEGIRA